MRGAPGGRWGPGGGGPAPRPCCRAYGEPPECLLRVGTSAWGCLKLFLRSSASKENLKLYHITEKGPAEVTEVGWACASIDPPLSPAWRCHCWLEEEGDKEEVTPPLLPSSSIPWGPLFSLPSLRPRVGTGAPGRRRCTHRKRLQTLKVFSFPAPTTLPSPSHTSPLPPSWAFFPPHPVPQAAMMWQEGHQPGPGGHGAAHEQKPRVPLLPSSLAALLGGWRSFRAGLVVAK